MTAKTPINPHINGVGSPDANSDRSADHRGEWWNSRFGLKRKLWVAIWDNESLDASLFNSWKLHSWTGEWSNPSPPPQKWLSCRDPWLVGVIFIFITL
jgi:hypothetical protein